MIKRISLITGKYCNYHNNDNWCTYLLEPYETSVTLYCTFGGQHIELQRTKEKWRPIRTSLCKRINFKNYAEYNE